jgi:hypothetical protein
MLPSVWWIEKLNFTLCVSLLVYVCPVSGCALRHAGWTPSFSCDRASRSLLCVGMLICLACDVKFDFSVCLLPNGSEVKQTQALDVSSAGVPPQARPCV